VETVDRRVEAWDEFRELWRELLDAVNDGGGSVLVEGPKDRLSVRALGMRAPVHEVNQGQPISEIAHRLERTGGRLIVLTDWDRAGGRLAQKVKEQLAEGPVRVDLEFRRRLARALRGEVVHVEGLAGWARRLAESDGATLEELWDEDAATRRPTG
jgi:5S rRNA maturation endonuclease (ribonuclease M5)